MKKLVDSVEAEHGDGIRFYLAAYDSVPHPDTHIGDEYKNFTTLVMVSTRRDTVTGHHMDYYTPSKGKRGFTIMAAPQNQGELCPPPATCAAYGATLLPQ